MHGVTVRPTRPVRPSRMNTRPPTSWVSAMCRWEGRFDPASCAGTHTRGNNRVATCDAGHAKAYLSRRGNAQP